MFYHIALFTGCLITQFTGKRVLTTMYAFMFYYITLLTALLCTSQVKGR